MYDACIYILYGIDSVTLKFVFRSLNFTRHYNDRYIISSESSLGKFIDL